MGGGPGYGCNRKAGFGPQSRTSVHKDKGIFGHRNFGQGIVGHINLDRAYLDTEILDRAYLDTEIWTGHIWTQKV